MWQGPFGTMWQLGPGVHHHHILDLPPHASHIITLITSDTGLKTGNPRPPAPRLPHNNHILDLPPQKCPLAKVRWEL